MTPEINRKPKLAIILGIRPDVIRASIVLGMLRSCPDIETVFVWSGQHYSDNLKDVFFRELQVEPPDMELGASGSTDAEICASVIARLHPALESLQPEAAIFLGDTNTVMGCLAAAQLNIPIIHIEGCMRSHDWRMPEEKYRTTIDHLSDVIYAYFDEYKEIGVAEGLFPERIVVVQNLIVDVLQKYYFERKAEYDEIAGGEFFSRHGIQRGEYYLMTCHRRENVHDRASLGNILDLLKSAGRRVYFPASYRTQRVLKETGLELPGNVTMVDPIGYKEFLALMVNSRGVITDSGTVVEETCILGVPSLQVRKSTERPQVYDAGSSVKFDPSEAGRYDRTEVLSKFERLFGKGWEHGLGDGRASERIVKDLRERALGGGFRMHSKEHYGARLSRSYREDGL